MSSADDILFANILSPISVTSTGRIFNYIKYEDYDSWRHKWEEDPRDPDDPNFILIDCLVSNTFYDAILYEDGSVMDIDALYPDRGVFEDFRIDSYPAIVAALLDEEHRIRVNSRGIFFHDNQSGDPFKISRITDLATFLIGFV